MENVLLLDVSVGSGNRGDEIIMECVREELAPILDANYELTLPTHVSAFHWYQVLRNSNQIRMYSKCRYKFVGGSNILIPDLLTHYPQWNINIFNYRPLVGSILVGVGAGAGAEEGSNLYTRFLYRRMLNNEFYHSVRDERSKVYLEGLGLKAINTGCVTMWKLTPEHCAKIPTKKASCVVFTLTNGAKGDFNQKLIDTLLESYSEVVFWPQGRNDYSFFRSLKNTISIQVLSSTKSAYDVFLQTKDTDYVGTRLHGGIYAMRHGRRSIIIAIDERAKAINEKNHLNCITINQIDELKSLINSEFETKVIMPFEDISRWKAQFGL